MIRRIEKNELDTCLQVIRKSFATVAKEFALTKENCPKHTSFMPPERLYRQFADNRPMFAYFKNDEMIGYFSLGKNSDGSFELNNLAVLPEYRHCGYGEEMVVFAKEQVKKLNADKITIGIIEESVVLKNWYMKLGFVPIGTKKFEHLPFTVGFMELYL